MDEEILAEIAATVLSLHADTGTAVESGDVLILLESMKMEIPVVADRDGTLVRMAVDVGSTVQEGDLMAVLRGVDPVPA